MEQKQASPLAGKTILVTRPEAQAADFVEKLKRIEANPVLFPAIAISAPETYNAVDAAIGNLAGYDWVIFTSVNGVRFFTARMQALQLPVDALKKCRIAAIGPATASLLQELGLHPEFVPSKFVAEVLAEEFPDVEGQKILLPRADIARKNLKHDLEARGASVEELVAYRTSGSHFPEDEARQRLSQEEIDIITFTSSSTVRYFREKMEKLGMSLPEARIACIGPITANTARELQFDVWTEAETYTIDGLINSMEKALANEKTAKKAQKER
ncbi:MAG: uroporphyrinogen-III synthase [Bacteroidia bacterium]